ncbi:hypothetical protein K438DRAFT_1780230 [Mycena galopus ATCC 62051]|nr:hypothetical protein K438DRAFT_1780230 [Mycena galopus ATCC 62051]
MLTVREIPPSRESGVKSNPVVGSTAHDWLSHMISAVKTIAAGADFTPIPYIGGILGTVVILLETVNKMKQNRVDLRDLWGNTFEIVLLLQAKVSAHGELAGLRLAGLCEDFVRVAVQIDRYRNRLNELRSNFLLAVTIDTNVNVAGIRKSVSAPHETYSQAVELRGASTRWLRQGIKQIQTPVMTSQNFLCGSIDPSVEKFRRIALGEINLLYETALTSKAHKVRVFTARISGESGEI